MTFTEQLLKILRSRKFWVLLAALATPPALFWWQGGCLAGCAGGDRCVGGLFHRRGVGG